MSRAIRLWAAGAAILSLAGGAGLVSFGVTTGLAKKAAPAARNIYAESSPCAACPAGVSLDSVEVQARQGTTLLIVRGRWPGSVDGLKDNVRVVANDLELVLKPHGSENAFEIISATRSGRPLAQGGVGASIQQGALLVAIAPALGTPLNFQIGFWDGTSYQGRIPRSGMLAWTGSGAPAAASPSVSASASPGPGSGLDPTALPAGCSSIPNSGAIPAYLQLGALTSLAPTADPRTGAPARKITAALGGSAFDVTSPFTIVAVVSHRGEVGASGQARPIDRAGTEQLYYWFDGASKHKAIRTFRQGRWSILLDAAAGALTTDLTTKSFSFYWTDLAGGDVYGFITAAGTSCRSAGLDTSLQPQQVAA